MATTREEMITFLWEGKDRRGVRLKGERQARNPNLVKAALRQQGITPSRVRRKPKALFGGAGHRIKGQDVAVFTRQMATMLKAGIPLVQGLEIVGNAMENPRMQTMVGKLRTDVESGNTFSEALAKHPVQFDELYVNLVASGESAGVLDEVLENIATYKERIESIKGKVKKALYYPAAIIAVAIIVMIILLVYVVPQFEDMFRSYGADLPAFTQLVVSMSRWMQSYGWLFLLAFIAAIVVIVMFKNRNKKFSHFIDRASLKLPVIGGVLEKSALSRFARTLATTFAAGVPLVDALKTVAGATGNVVYEDAVHRIREDVATGHQLQLAMQQTSLFPPMVVQMTAIGEETGALDAMLTKVADFYEEEVNNTVDALSSLLEPAIIVFIGALVGGMVIALYLPIFKLAATI